MRRLLFDIESNGLLDDVSKIHCIVVKDLDTLQDESYYDDTSVVHSSRVGTVSEGIAVLSQATELNGQKILTYDLPVIDKLFGLPFKPLQTGPKIIDTLICSEHMWLELKLKDFKFRKANPNFPGNLIGSHSLEAWGYRLGNHKGSFGKQADWQKFTLEMLEYALQDLSTNKSLLDLILSKNYSEAALRNEHNFQWVIFQQEQHGFKFDRDAAVKLYGELSQIRNGITKELQDQFDGWYTETKTPEYYELKWSTGSERGATKGACETRRKELKLKPKECTIEPGPNKKNHTPFNPSSHDHIAKFLVEKYGWSPKVFGDDGKPSTTEEILEKLNYPEIPKIVEHLMVSKRIGQLAEGKKAWLKAEVKGRIHGQVKTNGAVSTRVTHNEPNLSQVPAVDKPFGKECRALFTADEGHVLVGGDASGIQLRSLAHYLAHWDDGKYVDIILNGDVHTVHQQAAGFKTRDMAKTFI